MTSLWLKFIEEAEKTVIIQDNKLKAHYKFPNGHEMAEEYNHITNILLRRAWRKRSGLQKAGDWEIEVGDPEPQYSAIDSLGIKESSSNPYVVKRVTKSNIEWRIRNLPYSLDTYSVKADQNETCIVVRTSNKKYFKKLKVQELERVGLTIEQNSLEYSHKHNTLIITYKKPCEVIQMEATIFKILKNKVTLNDENFDCAPS